MTHKFIQRANLKKGALSRQLGVPIKKNIPITLLNKIIKAKAGDTIRNPTSVGKRRIKVTRLLERRVLSNLRDLSYFLTPVSHSGLLV